VVLVGGIDRAKNIKVDGVPAKGLPALHHQVESALAAAVNPVAVVHLVWAVNAQADEEMMFLEERTPVIVEQQAVGLEGVLHDLFGSAVGFNEFHCFLEEVEFHQRRLATLPRHRDFLGAMRFEQLSDVGLERGLGHPTLFVWVQCLLGQEEAISAINIAGGPARLRQQVKAGGALKDSVVMLELLIIGGYTRRNSKAKKANMR